MLRELTADSPRFRPVGFKPGLNLLVADRTETSTDEQSRNSVGKTSVVELLHFLLGAGKTELVTRRENKNATFRLLMDWPGRNEPVSIRRSGAKPNDVYLSPDVTVEDGALFSDAEWKVPIAQWRGAIDRDLFRIEAGTQGLSGRTLLAFSMRRTEAGGFHTALREGTHRGSSHQATANLCYLLGMDWALALRYGEMSQREQTRKKLAEAAKDPTWNQIVGSSADLRGQLRAVEQRIGELQRQISEFQVVPEYEEINRKADGVHARIVDLRSVDVIDRRNLADMERAVSDAVEPDDHYLERAYAELGIMLGREVRASFDQVKEFHHAVVRNRRQYLNEEVERLRERISANEAERAELGRSQAGLLKTLNEGGALDTLTVMQSALARERAQEEVLQRRLSAAKTIEQSKREIEAEKLSLEEEMKDDIAERRDQEGEASALFNRFARSLYGNERTPYLAFEPKRSSLDILLQLDADNSSGISNMKTFCFDLTWAVIAHRAGRGPDFLVHDSKLYDGVDERQVARALDLAAAVADEEGMQYIVTMNSDDLQKVVRLGFDPKPYIIEPRLNDTPTGGLFGFRF